MRTLIGAARQHDEAVVVAGRRRVVRRGDDRDVNGSTRRDRHGRGRGRERRARAWPPAAGSRSSRRRRRCRRRSARAAGASAQRPCSSRGSRTRARRARRRASGRWRAATLTRPPPSSSTEASLVRAVSPQAGPAEDISADFTCPGVQPGCCWSRSAAAPATCGAAMLVPSKTANGAPANSRSVEERICPPGAATSGLSRWSKFVGPGRREARDHAAAAGLDLARIERAETRKVVRPPSASMKARRFAPSRSEIIPAVSGEADRDEVRLAGAVVHEDDAVAPAARTRSTFESKVQPPRETSATVPLSERGRERREARVVGVGADGRAEVALDRLAVGARDRPDVDEGLVGVLPGRRHVEVEGEGHVLEVRRRSRSGGGQLGAEDVQCSRPPRPRSPTARCWASRPSRRPKSSRSFPAEMTGTTPAAATLSTRLDQRVVRGIGLGAAAGEVDHVHAVVHRRLEGGDDLAA